ncbi:Imm1 family immunity protein [Actinoalloteichus hymeniacidonis]|uniref:Immunity protein Imm1 n=1 Tax=Actinoalloteichus hymeniacidonis TaxID=340345 RepID=A0AAC9HLS3_9PSEU|nr:Imm1 family immunity protein [Actinoalloteichus hymeniacidonis]AOS61627.1 Immunity protein Imm1 [Actinoalloteichus hymeniacidonis]MBB5910362.1 hypothetical protein [Actinoalloteichus hymeniacidonis]
MTCTLHAMYKTNDDTPVVVRDQESLDKVIDEVFETYLDDNAIFIIVERPKVEPNDLPDHQLAIDLRLGCAVTAIYFIGETSSGEEGQWFSLNPHPIDDAPELCYDLHTGDRFPANAVITMDDFRRALHEFMDNGGVRPDCIDWQPFRDNPELTDSLSR